MGHQLGKNEVVIADRAGLKARDLHRRVQDGRLAGEVALDPLPGGLRVGHVGVDPLGGDEVPLAPASQDLGKRRAHHRAPGGQRRLALVPGVAERVVAVTDMDRVLVGKHTMGPGGGARDHQVVAAKVQGLDGPGVERQQRAEVVRRRPQPLERAGDHAATLEAPLGTPRVVDRREDVGLRIHLAELEQDPLGAAEVQEEVVDQRDAHAVRGRARSHRRPRLPARLRPECTRSRAII